MKKRQGTQRIVHDDPRWLARQPRPARDLPPHRADHDHTEDMWLAIDSETELRPASLHGAITQLSNVSSCHSNQMVPRSRLSRLAHTYGSGTSGEPCPRSGSRSRPGSCSRRVDHDTGEAKAGGNKWLNRSSLQLR